MLTHHEVDLNHIEEPLNHVEIDFEMAEEEVSYESLPSHNPNASNPLNSFPSLLEEETKRIKVLLQRSNHTSVFYRPHNA